MRRAVTFFCDFPYCEIDFAKVKTVPSFGEKEVKMFNGMFNDGDCGGGCEKGGCFGGCNCTWILLIILFLCCCGGKMKNFHLNVNPCCLILVVALLFCNGGLSIGGCK